MRAISGVYRHILETSSASILIGALMVQSVEKSRIQDLLSNADQALKKSSQSNSNDDESTKQQLAAIIKQTGLNGMDIPEIYTLMNSPQSQSDAITIEKRKALISAIPLETPAKGWFASGFGKRNDPMTNKLSEHKGLDISNEVGTPIYAPSDGIIRYASKFGRFGNYISIVHGYGILTKYAHLNDIVVKKGQIVKKGDLIGHMGNSGKSTGTHLHYEIWINDHAFNPYVFLTKPNSNISKQETGTPAYMLLAGQP
jgi:murein DD-endopeptidase MepM/ murein hydrolase activator NlpD